MGEKLWGRTLFRLLLPNSLFIFLLLSLSNQILNAKIVRDFASNQVCSLSETVSEKKGRDIRTIIYIWKKMQRPFDAIDGIWDQGLQKNQAQLKKSLEEFMTHKRGQSLRKIKPKFYSADTLNSELESLGFIKKTVPLIASFKPARWWLTNGSRTDNKNHPEVVPMTIYLHKDGSMVRVKHQGIPDSSDTVLRRRPHFVRSVLLVPDFNLCDQGTCEPDSSWENEAFKVTDDFVPVPKAPARQYGLNLDIHPVAGTQKDQFNEVLKDLSMEMVHQTLQINCENNLNFKK